MSRKGRNIYKRKDGRWEGRIKNTLSVGGKYLSFYGHSYREVKEKMEGYKPPEKAEEHAGTMTVAQALEIWVQDNKDRWKQSTYACYKQQIHKYILPGLGGRLCAELSNSVLSEALHSDPGLSKTCQKSLCGILTRCIKYINSMYDYDFKIPDLQLGASRHDLQDALDARQLPTPDAAKKLEKYLLAHVGDDTCAGILLAMYTGIRIGELCAMTWENIDLETGTLSVRSTMQRIRQFDADGGTRIMVGIPKSSSSMRRIPIPLLVLKELREHHQGKEGYLIKGRKKEYAEPRTVQYRFQAILKKCDIEPFNFHKLRHIFASNCLQQGFDFKTLSELMGHSNIQTTLNIYVHSDEERKRLLMENLKIYDVA